MGIIEGDTRSLNSVHSSSNGSLHVMFFRVLGLGIRVQGLVFLEFLGSGFRGIPILFSV